MRYDKKTRNWAMFTFGLALSTVGRSAGAQPLPSQIDLQAPAPDSFEVTFETTAGRFVIRAHSDWSPLGAERLYHLANARYYDGVVFYRVGETASYPGGKVVQFGLTNVGAINNAWHSTGIGDEKVLVGHRRGMVGFARDGPNSRTVELAIDLSPNTGLDTVSYNGVIGFPPVAEVVTGMATLDRLNGEHGNAPVQQWDSIKAGGSEFLDRRFPGLDRVRTAQITQEWWPKGDG